MLTDVMKMRGMSCASKHMTFVSFHALYDVMGLTP